MPTPASRDSLAPSKVVVARDSGGALKLLDKAMQALFDCDSPVKAWKRVARPGGLERKHKSE